MQRKQRAKADWVEVAAGPKERVTETSSYVALVKLNHAPSLYF